MKPTNTTPNLKYILCISTSSKCDYQRCKVDKNVSTQDETFELVPVPPTATVKMVKQKKAKKKKKDNQRKERKATQTLAIVLGKIPGGAAKKQKA